jgi:hypothetical protein
MGKNLACQRAMRLKARNIEGHCLDVDVTKKICHKLLARLFFEIEIASFLPMKSC